jgi:hypothetical protein
MTTISKLTDGGPAILFTKVHITGESPTEIKFGGHVFHHRGRCLLLHES